MLTVISGYRLVHDAGTGLVLLYLADGVRWLPFVSSVLVMIFFWMVFPPLMHLVSL